jgi:hypothetical protein
MAAIGVASVGLGVAKTSRAGEFLPAGCTGGDDQTNISPVRGFWVVSAGVEA